ncbi:MAG: hypothetical protein ABI665_25070 [Vicinamibacterales bacterium]
MGDFYYESVESVRADAARFGVPASAVTGPSFFLGYTAGDSSPVRVTVSNGTGRASAAAVGELAITTAHELYGHAAPATQGKPWQHEKTYPMGTVNRQIEEIERRTRKLYEPQKQF